METVISQEGLGSLITSMKNTLTGRDKHGVKGSDAKPGEMAKAEKAWSNEAREQLKKLKEAVTKFYLNDNWISKQTLVTGEISGTEIAPALNFNGELGKDPLDNVNKGIGWATKWSSQWLGIVGDVANKVKSINDATHSVFKQGSDEVTLEAQVKMAIKQFNAISDPINKFPKPQGCGLGNIAPVVEDVKARGVDKWVITAVVKSPKEGNVQALTKDQIKEAGSLIIKLIEGIEISKWFSWLDHSDGSKLNAWFDKHDDLFWEYYDRFDHHAADEIWVNVCDQLINEYAVIQALEKWIDRSIDGKASNEAFNNLVKAAGKDGLDPTATKAYAITQKLINSKVM